MAINPNITSTPYKEIGVSVPANGAVDIFEVFSYFRVLVQSASGLQVMWGNNGDISPLTGVGVGIKLADTITRVRLINPTGSTITATIAVGDGSITDDRLNVSGTLNVNVLSDGTCGTIADVSCGATATTSVCAARTARAEIIISNLAANGTVIRVGDSSTGAARGIEVAIGGTLILSTTAQIYVYNPKASAINIGVAEIY